MNPSGDTDQARLERAFATLRNDKGITALLVMTGDTGSEQENDNELRVLAKVAEADDEWVGAHAGTMKLAGAHWVRGRLCHRATGWQVPTLPFTHPAGRDDLAQALVKALDEAGCEWILSDRVYLVFDTAE